jgi:DNA polymerase I
MPLTTVLMAMQKRGIAVDKAVLSRAIVEYVERAKAIRAELATLGVVDTGSKALSKLFYETFGLPIVKRTKKNKAPSLDEDALKKLSVVASGTEMDNPARRAIMDKASHIIQLVLEVRGVEKILSTYLRGLPVAADGRVHCSWLEHGTKTGRLSSRGPNMQNQPEGIVREMYVAAPGHTLVSLDYSQIELRLMAYESEDEALIEAYEQERDVHSEEAAFMFHEKVVKVPSGERPDFVSYEERKFTKSFIYCLNYGGDIFAVMAAIPGMITITQGKIAQARYYQRHPGVALFRTRIQEQVRATRTVTNVLGRPRIFFGSISETIKSAYDHPMQSGAADIINTAMIRLHRKGLDNGLLLQIHDQLVFELPDSPDLDNTIVRIKAEMEHSITIRGRRVLLPVDVSIGRSWGKLEKWKFQKFYKP